MCKDNAWIAKSSPNSGGVHDQVLVPVLTLRPVAQQQNWLPAADCAVVLQVSGEILTASAVAACQLITGKTGILSKDGLG